MPPTTDQELLHRIACDPAVSFGKPVIKGTRLTVNLVLNSLAHGATAAEIVNKYDGLKQEDVQACLLFASKPVDGDQLIAASSDILSGTPVFAGTRVPVHSLIECLSAGDSIDAFLEGFPTVTRKQVFAFLTRAGDVISVEMRE